MSKSQLEKRKSNACVGEGVDDDAMGGPAKKPENEYNREVLYGSFLGKSETLTKIECLNCGKMVSYTGRNTQGMISHQGMISQIW
jgi:hypothetical protein